MNPPTAAKFIKDTLAADTGTGQINDSSAGTNPAGVASFWSNRVNSFQRDPSSDMTAFPYGFISIDAMPPTTSQKGELRTVRATVFIFDNTLDHTRLNAIAKALYGDFSLQSTGVPTYGLCRRRAVAVVDSTWNPLSATAETFNLEDMTLGPIGTEYKVTQLAFSLMFELSTITP